MKNYVVGLLGLCVLCLLVGCGGGSIQTVQPLAITSGAPPSGTTRVAYAGNGFLLTASGGKASYSWSWKPAAGSALPPGLTLSNGMISGIPTNAGTYHVNVTVSDSQSPATQTTAPYTITISDPATLTITSGMPPGGLVGFAYAVPQNCGIPCVVAGFPLTASGGVPPYSWHWVGANGSSTPPGLMVRGGSTPDCTANSPDYEICGTPSTAGTYDVIVTVADSASPQNVDSANYTIGIVDPPPSLALLAPPIRQQTPPKMPPCSLLNNVHLTCGPRWSRRTVNTSFELERRSEGQSALNSSGRAKADGNTAFGLKYVAGRPWGRR